MLSKTIIQSGAPDRMYHIMHDGITLVTAFFPIGRGEWAGKAQRSDDKYFKYFQHWARIHNDLVVYTTPENAERIRQIRLSFGRTNTQVYIVNDLEDIDKSMYTLMHDVGKHYPKYSLFPDKPEVSNPIYDFVMYTKFWCLAQASTVAATNKIAWIDFGFDHGGEYYKDNQWFDRTWNYTRPNGKVALFQIRELPSDPIFDCIRRTETYIQGNCIELDTDYAQQFYVDVRNQYEHLLRCGLLDDDQIILLMCHYEKPDIYCCLPSRWFSMLDEYRDDKKTGMHSDLLPEFFIISRRRRWYWTKHCLKFLKQEFNHLVRRYPL